MLILIIYHNSYNFSELFPNFVNFEFEIERCGNDRLLFLWKLKLWLPNRHKTSYFCLGLLYSNNACNA